MPAILICSTIYTIKDRYVLYLSGMLKPFLFLFLLLLGAAATAQTDTARPRPVKQLPRGLPRTRDTNAVIRRVPATVRPATPRRDTVVAAKKDSLVKPAVDTLALRRDSLAADSVRRRTDSLHQAAILAARPLTWEQDTLFRRILQAKYLPLNEPPVFMISAIWDRETDDYLFYLLTGLVLFLAFIRASFPKYFQQLFRMLFQTSFRQKQTREQLAQNMMPSLLMNLLFMLVAGTFIAVVVKQKNLTDLLFWYVFLYCVAGLIILYSFKFLFLRFTGWVFHVGEASETYIFIVFLVNKLLAVLLLPLLWLIAFSSGDFNVVVLTATLCIAGFLLLYRYFIALASVRDMLRVSAFHFFIYLCGVEILPIILIYKVLLSKTGFTI